MYGRRRADGGAAIRLRRATRQGWAARVRRVGGGDAIKDEIMGIFRARALPHPRNQRAGFIVLMAATALALFGPTGPAAAQGVVKSVHGDWQVRCDTPPGGQNEQCALIQSVTAEDRPNVGLTVIVLKNADQKYRLMRVLAPLGVLLPNGLGLRINSTDIGKVLYVRCLPNGCVAEVVMDDNLMKQLRGGGTATFIIYQTPEEGIGIPVSLKGFGEGFDKLP